MAEATRRFVGTLLAMFCRVLRMRMGRERLLECRFNKPGGTLSAYPYAELLGPKPRPRPEDQFVVGEVPNSEWRWEPAFRVALLSWLGELPWEPRMGQVTFVKLVLDFEAPSGRAMPASPRAELQAIVLSLYERARVLRTALAVVQRYVTTGSLVKGAMTTKARS